MKHNMNSSESQAGRGYATPRTAAATFAAFHVLCLGEIWGSFNMLWHFLIFINGFFTHFFSIETNRTKIQDSPRWYGSIPALSHVAVLSGFGWGPSNLGCQIFALLIWFKYGPGPDLQNNNGARVPSWTCSHQWLSRSDLHPGSGLEPWWSQVHYLESFHLQPAYNYN